MPGAAFDHKIQKIKADGSHIQEDVGEQPRIILALGNGEVLYYINGNWRTILRGKPSPYDTSDLSDIFVDWNVASYLSMPRLVLSFHDGKIKYFDGFSIGQDEDISIPDIQGSMQQMVRQAKRKLASECKSHLYKG